MTSSSSDDDLTQNSVVATISQSYPELLEKVIAEGWIICAPRKPLAHINMNFDQDEHWIMRHILVPEPLDEGRSKTHFRFWFHDLAYSTCNVTYHLD